MTKKDPPLDPQAEIIDLSKLTDMGRFLVGGIQALASSQEILRKAQNSRKPEIGYKKLKVDIVRFTDEEIDAWIKVTSFTDMKNARDAFMSEDRAKGLSETFEERWRLEHKRGPGRPPKKRP